MAAENFNPIDRAREPREKGWEDETEEIIEHLRNRGDLRIGQLLINAVSKDVDIPDRPTRDKAPENMTEEEVQEYIEECRQHEHRCKAKIEAKLWSIEADKLLKLLDQLDDKREEQ